MSTLPETIHSRGHAQSNELQPNGQDATRAFDSGPSGSQLPPLSENGDVHCVMGQFPTDEEIRLLEFSKSVQKTSLTVLVDYLGRVVTLSGAMIGGTIAAVKTSTMSIGMGTAIIILLFASLTFALAGLLPRSYDVDHSRIDELRALEAKIDKTKRRAVTGSSLFLFLAIAVAIVGFITSAAINHSF